MKIIFLIAVNLMKEIFRKKDIYVLVIMLLILMLYLAKAAFFGINDIYRYLNEIGLGMVFFFSILIAVPHSGRLMIEEIRSKTIYPLLSKPVRRSYVIAGKFFGSLLISGISFSAFFLLFSLISVLKQGAVSLPVYLQVYIAGLMMLSVLNAMSICLSVYCTFSTTITLSFLIFFLMSWFGESIRDILYKFSIGGEVIYYLLPHFEFFDLRHRLIHLWSPLPAWVMTGIILYAAFYTSALLLLAFQGFKKKWL